MKVFIHAKCQINLSSPFRDIALLRILQFDWLSEHAWPCPLNMVIATCRKLWCLSACKKQIIEHSIHKILHPIESCSLLVRKMFLEISQNSQGNTCARAPFLIKLQTWGLRVSTSVDNTTAVFHIIYSVNTHHSRYWYNTDNFLGLCSKS